jgi:hypothetical protein
VNACLLLLQLHALARSLEASLATSCGGGEYNSGRHRILIILNLT